MHRRRQESQDPGDASIVLPMTRSSRWASRSRENAAEEPKFTESWPRRLKHWVLGTAYALVPKRIGLLPRLLLLSVAHLLAPEAERKRLPQDPIYYGKRGLV